MTGIQHCKHKSISSFQYKYKLGGKVVSRRNTDLVIIQIVGQAADEELVSRVGHHCGHHTYRTQS